MPYENCTPHEINIYNADGTEVVETLPPAPTPIRLVARKELVGSAIGGAPIHRVVYDSVEGIDPRTQGLTYIVSLPCLQHVDLLRASAPGPDVSFMAPDTGPDSVVRDDQGNILGVRGFIAGW